VRDVRGEVELQPRRVGLQCAVSEDDAWRLEERAHHAAHFAILVAGKNGLSVEPADLEAVASAEALQVIDRQGELALTDTIRRALEVGKVVARHLLMGADEQMRELSAARACLGEELRDRCLQHVLGEEKCRLERYL